MPSKPVVLRVVNSEQLDRPSAGGDSMVASVPSLDMGTLLPHALHASLLPLVTKLSYEGADKVGEILHHADWIISNSPADVEQAGNVHNCTSCRAQVDQALTYLRENPNRYLLVGMLHWAGR